MSISELNAMSADAVRAKFRQCCTSDEWVERMVSSMPYGDATELKVAADRHWKNMGEADYLQAFDGHPKIGNVSSLKEKYADTKSLASGEQSRVNSASDDVIDRLALGNKDYEEKHGFIFIVCASGKSAEEMLGLLESRLSNDRAAELVNAREEQRKIFQIRIEKIL